jgi:hypothetical protein
MKQFRRRVKVMGDIRNNLSKLEELEEENYNLRRRLKQYENIVTVEMVREGIFQITFDTNNLVPLDDLHYDQIINNCLVFEMDIDAWESLVNEVSDLACLKKVNRYQV